jgi:hypothetical protein
MIYPNSEGKKILYEYYKILRMVSIKEIWYMECKCVLNLMRQNNQFTDWLGSQPTSQPNQTKPNQNKPNTTQPNNQSTNQRVYISLKYSQASSHVRWLNGK